MFLSQVIKRFRSVNSCFKRHIIHVPNSSQTVYVLKNGMQVWICAQCLEGAKEPFDWPVVSFHLLQHCVIDADLFLSRSRKQVTCIPVASANYEKFPTHSLHGIWPPLVIAQDVFLSVCSKCLQLRRKKKKIWNMIDCWRSERRSKTHKGLNRMLLKQTKQDRMQIFEGILFSKAMNNTKTNKSRSHCQFGASGKMS